MIGKETGQRKFQTIYLSPNANEQENGRTVVSFIDDFLYIGTRPFEEASVCEPARWLPKQQPPAVNTSRDFNLIKHVN